MLASLKTILQDSYNLHSRIFNLEHHKWNLILILKSHKQDQLKVHLTNISSNNFKLELINCLDFSTRNFGMICDRGFVTVTK